MEGASADVGASARVDKPAQLYAWVVLKGAASPATVAAATAARATPAAAGERHGQASAVGSNPTAATSTAGPALCSRACMQPHNPACARATVPPCQQCRCEGLTVEGQVCASGVRLKIQLALCITHALGRGGQHARGHADAAGHLLEALSELWRREGGAVRWGGRGGQVWMGSGSGYPNVHSALRRQPSRAGRSSARRAEANRAP